MILKLFVCALVLDGVLALTLHKGIHIRSSGQLSDEELLRIDLYLRRYGYLTDYPKGTEVLASAEDREDALERFQDFNNIPETGVYDAATAELFAKPRCGCPDIEPDNSDPSSPQSFSTGRRWDQNSIDWRIRTFSAKLSQTEVEEETRRAFEIWSKAANIQFNELSSGEVDIRLDFFSGLHYDGANNAFDGPGNVLAHAFLPPVGDTHFDEDENWVVNRSGIDYFTVAAHEIGHAIGLLHSEFSDALMAPFYNGYDPNFQLHFDDIAGAQFLYGPPLTETTTTTSTTTTPTTTTPTTTTTTPTTTTTTPTTTTPTTTTTTLPPGERPEICSLRFNSILTDFNGDYLASVESNRLLRISPNGQLISDTTQRSVFKKSPSKPDAAFRIDIPQRFMMIKGRKLFHFNSNGQRLRIRFIRGPSNQPKKARAAVAFSSTDVSVIGFNKVWKMNPYTGRIQFGSHRKICEEFPGIPNGIDAAVVKDASEILFFKRNLMYTFDRNQNQVIRTEDKGTAILSDICDV